LGSQSLLFGPATPPEKRRRARRRAGDVVARLLALADETADQAEDARGDERAALEDVVDELRALARVVEAARAGRLPSGVLRVVGDAKRKAAAKARGMRW
jgi:hypothetical protein